MSRASIDLYAEELQRAEPADPVVLAWEEIVEGVRRLGVCAAVLFAIVFGVAAIIAIASGGQP